MKVGTDGVLLGAIATAKDSKNILDIGSGTGLLSLQLAQKSNALIDAVELDEKAAEQAAYNFKISKWAKRLWLHFCPIQEFALKTRKTYDLIISNPPYFHKHTNKNQRSTARSQQELSFLELITVSKSLLSKNGKFWVIIPYDAVDEFLEICQEQQLHLHSSCTIKGNFKVVPKRIVLSLGHDRLMPLKSSLTIEKDQRHDYTEEYLKLVEPYLL